MSNAATPGMPWREIARSAYKAYAASTGCKNFLGDPMPEFDALPPAIQTAWEASARQVRRCLDVMMDGPAPDESIWSGWVPPR